MKKPKISETELRRIQLMGMFPVMHSNVGGGTIR